MNTTCMLTHACGSSECPSVYCVKHQNLQTQTSSHNSFVHRTRVQYKFSHYLAPSVLQPPPSQISGAPLILTSRTDLVKKEVARRGRSTNVRNVGTFKDFILSSKHSEGTEGYEREFYPEMVLLRNAAFSWLNTGLFGTMKGSSRHFVPG